MVYNFIDGRTDEGEGAVADGLRLFQARGDHAGQAPHLLDHGPADNINKILNISYISKYYIILSHAGCVCVCVCVCEIDYVCVCVCVWCVCARARVRACVSACARACV